MTAAIIAGRRFDLSGPGRPENIQPDPYPTRANWTLFKSWRGDRPPGDNPKVRRVRWDGWAAPFPAGDIITVEYDVRYVRGVFATGLGQWGLDFELHSSTLPGDKEQAGPVSIGNEWSESAKKNVGRVTLRQPVKNDAGNVIGVISKPIGPGFDVPLLIPQRFRIECRQHPTNGFLGVWLWGRKIADYTGPFGYGDGRVLSPRIGNYSDDLPSRGPVEEKGFLIRSLLSRPS